MKNSEKGQLTIHVLIFSSIAIVMLAGFVVWTDTNVKLARRSGEKSLALAIAEAGIEYYRWHLAHAPEDYTDGNATSSPSYTHEYFDRNGNPIGEFVLEITPPPYSSTIVTIVSTGKVYSDSTISKKIKVKLGIPSLAKYSVAANADIRFGEGTEVFGILHSNGGIRFDGVAHNLVTSAKDKYGDPDHGGGQEFGVHTHISPQDPLPPASVPVRPDVFTAGRSFPVPALDFTGITQTLSSIRNDAQTEGFYATSSEAVGYSLILKTDDTFDLYKVTVLEDPPSGCKNNQGQDKWGTWSVKTKTLLGNYPFPSNGLIFIEDDAWVEGQINTARLTVAAGRFPDNPSKRASITVNNDLLYSNYNGDDVLGLIAQENINIGLMSEDDLRIDAALISQNGRVGRFYYPPKVFTAKKCSPNDSKSKITTYGMIASNKRYGFAYTDGTGYAIRNVIYDGNLLYGPPPSFPLTSDQYEQIFWEEVK